MRVLIVGAGIGGLTTALILHRLGIGVTLIEAASEITELGTGINLLPHGAGVLHELGLGPRLAAASLQTRAIEYRTQYGQLILRDPRGLHAGSPWPQYSIHRGRLQAVLLEKVRQTLSPDDILVGHSFERFEQTKKSVTARLLRRADGQYVDFDADLLIGADGIHSAVCRQIHRDVAPLKFSGTMMWRGVVEAEPFLDGETMIVAGHHDTKTVIYPIATRTAGQQTVPTNWVAEINIGKDASYQQEDWSRVAKLDEFAYAFEGFRFGFVDVPRLIHATKRIFVYPMVDRDALPHWSDKRVTLLGDAAHPMYPIGANGASQAILDAAALGQALDEERDVEAALVLYEKRRLPVTAEVVTSNRGKGPEAVLELARQRIHGPDDDVDALISRAEIDAITRNYQKVAGFDAATLTHRAQSAR
jgi:2-polyprenyl-6-methoxyphenol hydroxylase-like FAD-dependent oxidoreductase